MKSCNDDVDTEDHGNVAENSASRHSSIYPLNNLWFWLHEGRHDFPPQLTRLDKILWTLSLGLSLVALCYLLDRFCIGFCTNWLTDCVDVFFDYAAISILPVILFVDRYIRRRTTIHRLRLQDYSAVYALFVEARNVKPRVNRNDKDTDEEKAYNRDFDAKKRNLLKEVDRLEGRSEIWTEYEILNLEQMLIDFLKIDDLKERAKSELDELEEYAYDSAVSYDLRKYDRWEEKIRNYTEMIDEGAKDDQIDETVRDRNAEPLRAAVKTLQEHIASYSVSWAEGSWIVRSLIICCGVAIPILIVLGTLPIFHPSLCTLEGILQFYNWGYLGTSGALTAVVLSLRNSDATEVGATEGKRELWQMVSGTALGFVAGILAYSMISGGLLKGPLVPITDDPTPITFGRSVIWAFAAGFAFEKVFDRMKNDTSLETSLR